MLTTLRVIKRCVPVLALFGLFSTSCKNDDKWDCKEGNPPAGECVVCTMTYHYSNGGSQSYTQTLCAADFSSQAAFSSYVNDICAYDGHQGQGSGYTYTVSVDCHKK